MESFSKILISVCIGFIGGLVFTLLHLPLSWLLGSLLSIVVWKIWRKGEVAIHPSMRNGSLVMIGYMLGISFTYETLMQMVKMLPAMLTSTVLLIIFSVLLSLFLAKFTGISIKTAMIGMMPGGFSHMVILGEELKDVDISNVTFLQLIRLLSVIYIVPAIARIDWFSNVGTTGTFDVQNGASASASIYEFILFILVTLASTFIAVKIKFPTPYLLGPLLGTAMFVISGFTPFQLPNFILVVSQIFLGIHIGIMVEPNKLKNGKRFCIGAVLASIGLLLSTFFIALFIVWLYPISLGTSFLSAAPGGIAEMGLTAISIGADLTVVTGFQMFRIFFILFLVPPLILWSYNSSKQFGK